MSKLQRNLFCLLMVGQLVFGVDTALGQMTPNAVQKLLDEPIQLPGVIAFQLQRYLIQRIPPLPVPKSAQEWEQQEAKIEKHILDDIAFHGWPRAWVDSPPDFQQAGVIESDKGYRIVKLRYEIVPGFDGYALLYEPSRIEGKAPAILNVIGHEPMGNAAEYEQKRCINFAKRGIVALSLGWMGFGELDQAQNAHDFAADLDLVGSNALGLFYLAMRRGLDYLAMLPQVDSGRLGLTGLSGGGWQTIMLSSTDKRVAVAVEVAGFGSLQSNLTHPVDTDEIEENATDLAQGQDYPFFVAIRAPRPTLLIHNAEDDCCFRAALVKPYIYDQVLPFYKQFGKPDALAWYESTDPGTHNYQLVNREHAYRFFDEYFGIPAAPDEIFSSTEIRSPEELTVELPKENLTIVGLARQLAGSIRRSPMPGANQQHRIWIGAEREKLESVVRYKAVSVEHAFRIRNTKQLAIETLSYRFDFSNGLSASAVWLKANGADKNAPVTMVLHDKGYANAAQTVSEHVNRGEQVLALDLIFNGNTRPQVPDPADWEMLASTMGERPLGLEAAQLLAVANWLRKETGHAQIQLETDGMRAQVISLVAAAIESSVFIGVQSHHAIGSLGYLLDQAVPFRSAPDLFCLDLYKDFDLDMLATMAAPTKFRDAGPSR